MGDSLVIKSYAFVDINPANVTIYFTLTHRDNIDPNFYTFTLQNITNPGDSLNYPEVFPSDVQVGNYPNGANRSYTATIDLSATYQVLFIANYSSGQLHGQTTITPSGGGGGGGAICFLGNAPVLTPSGYKRIDSLVAGDMVCTADGRDVAIQRVKHQRVITPSASVNPYIIPAGQFGATENLAISPRHCVAVPGSGMVEARELGLRQMSMRAAFDYYNLELPEWDNMVVAGVEVESLAPKKRVVMTAAEFRGLVTAQGSPVNLAKLSRFAEMLADGRVAVTMSKKARRM